MLVKQGLGSGALVASVLAGLVSVAHAGDIKIVSGNQCRQIPTDSQWSLRPNGGVNMALGPITVSCPLVRDNHAATTGLAPLKVNVFLEKPADVVTCTAYSYSGLDGSMLGMSDPRTATGGTRAVKQLEWLQTLNVAGQTNVNSMWSLICTVPPLGAIISIRYDEG